MTIDDLAIGVMNNWKGYAALLPITVALANALCEATYFALITSEEKYVYESGKEMRKVPRSLYIDEVNKGLARHGFDENASSMKLVYAALKFQLTEIPTVRAVYRRFHGERNLFWPS